MWLVSIQNFHEVFLVSIPDSPSAQISRRKEPEKEGVEQVLRAALRTEKVRSLGDSPSISWCVYAVNLIGFCVCEKERSFRKREEEERRWGRHGGGGQDSKA